MLQSIAGKGLTVHPAFASTYRFKPFSSARTASSGDLQGPQSGSGTMSSTIHFSQLASQLSKLVPVLDGKMQT